MYSKAKGLLKSYKQPFPIPSEIILLSHSRLENFSNAQGTVAKCNYRHKLLLFAYTLVCICFCCCCCVMCFFLRLHTNWLPESYIFMY